MLAALRAKLQTTRSDRRAVVAVEYALMASLIVGAILVALINFFGGVGNLMTAAFSKIGAQL